MVVMFPGYTYTDEMSDDEDDATQHSDHCVRLPPQTDVTFSCSRQINLPYIYPYYYTKRMLMSRHKYVLF